MFPDKFPRAFGLRQGKYNVSVGAENRVPYGGRNPPKQTFHPSVTDPSKATVIEVTEGSEIINVDIVVARPVTTFRATGRIVDGETGKPLPNIPYGLFHKSSKGDSHSSASGAFSNSEGEFKLASDGVPSPLTKLRLPDETQTRSRLRRDAEAGKTEIELKPCQNVVDFSLRPNSTGQ